jgi:D-3-phosphoglycerate dehydrogenase
MGMRCLIVDDVHPVLFDLLEEASIAYDYRPEWAKEECIKALPAYQGLIIRSKFRIDKQTIQTCSDLKFIGRAGAGLDNIDIESLRENDIALFHASEGNRVAVAEHTVGLILALINNIVRADKEVRNYSWNREENRGYELASMTVGLIGYGFMGEETAKRLDSFGCTVLAYDKFKTNYSSRYAIESTLENIKEQADIISLHIPLNDDSRGWIDSDFIQSVKKPFWLINTARGENVKLNDLLQGLSDGKILGAALDVMENEKVPNLSNEQLTVFNRLISCDTIILTPHIAGWTFESYKKISLVLGTKILNWSKGLNI